MKDESLKVKILNLRKEGKSYNEISNALGCSKATISYHCKRNNLNDIGLKRLELAEDLQNKIKDYYKTHTIEETANKFNVGVSTVKKYSEKKRIILNEEERKQQAYIRVKTYRQRTKEKAIKYKGGKCSECGYDKCSWALEFHHLDPSKKDFRFSQYSNHSWEIIEKELDKCILVCSNCHREIHYNQFIKNGM